MDITEAIDTARHLFENARGGTVNMRRSQALVFDILDEIVTALSALEEVAFPDIFVPVLEEAQPTAEPPSEDVVSTEEPRVYGEGDPEDAIQALAADLGQDWSAPKDALIIDDVPGPPVTTDEERAWLEIEAKSRKLDDLDG